MKFRSILFSVCLFSTVVFAAQPYAPHLTWEHSGLDVDGDPEDLAGWQATIKDPISGTEIDLQTLDDPSGAARAWTLDPVSLEVGPVYDLEFTAFDKAGNFSEPAKATLEVKDTVAPEPITSMTIHVNCPEGRECTVFVNGVEQ